PSKSSGEAQEVSSAPPVIGDIGPPPTTVNWKNAAKAKKHVPAYGHMSEKRHQTADCEPKKTICKNMLPPSMA
ncbi:hypothetical protein, partial [Komagataeibacter xylinus]|uniref:hypothetical protein n=1 Tax=Komagataeibacter xylinus TaxID=28448 RepID=UPI001C3F387B